MKYSLMPFMTFLEKKKGFEKQDDFMKLIKKKSPFVGTLDFIQAIKYYIL
jgi:hypothetical protein